VGPPRGTFDGDPAGRSAGGARDRLDSRRGLTVCPPVQADGRDPSQDLYLWSSLQRHPFHCVRLAGSRESTICLVKAMVLFALVIGTAIDGPAVWLDFWRLSVGRARASGRMAYATWFVEARLVSERKANPCDNRIPLALFGSGIIDQDTIHVPSGPVAAIVPGSVVANA
jgi:hypothetical protein